MLGSRAPRRPGSSRSGSRSSPATATARTRRPLHFRLACRRLRRCATCRRAVPRRCEGEVTVATKLAEAELVERIPDYDALIVRSETKVTAPILEAGKRLRVVGRAGVGVDNIDVAAATRHGILVVNAPRGNIVAA